ncbi:MAG TPA: S8 family serine peptidase [Fimbriimonadaceae bacterium]|nr:S8 family serine peptidase [Fimbriimonadaceae bacterium]
MKGLRFVSVFVLAGWAGVAQAALLIAQLNTNTAAGAVATRYGIQLLDVTPGAPFARFNVPAGLNADTIQVRMVSEGRAIWCEDDAQVIMPEHSGAGKGSTISAVGDRSTLQGLNSTFLRQIQWSSSLAATSGRRVKLAILDTGISPQQPALWAKVSASMNAIEGGQPPHDVARGRDTSGNGRPDEAVGHGTMVAGLVDQVGPQVQLVIARVADSDGVATAWTIIEGLAFAVNQGAEVANVSLGAIQRIPALSDVLDWTEQRGLLVVAAIGNNGQRRSLSPATISKVVSVAGVQSGDAKASFSNWEGKTLACAPASGLKSFWWDGTLGVWSGTSFAAPLVSGAIADCLRRRTTRLTPDAIRKLLRNAGDDVNAQNRSYRDQLGRRLNIAKLDDAIRRGR